MTFQKINIILLILCSSILNAQIPHWQKQWDYRYGGIKGELLIGFQQTSDGGFVLGGISNSGIGGDRTQPNWDPSFLTTFTNDFWLIKIDSTGNKNWEQRFGTTGDDELSALQQTLDGGYILGGMPGGGVNGDKTQSSQGGADYWIIKIDSMGAKEWDKRFGGTGGDFQTIVRQTKDAGFILGGYSYSDTGADKSQPSWGGDDYWVVKIDSNGIKQWDKRFGGNGQDDFYTLQQTLDGGFILGGYSYSDSSGDKSQWNWGTHPYLADYWVVKIDSLGNKEWDRRYGGTDEDELFDLKQTNDGGFILAGISAPGISGDKTQSNPGYWIVKIDGLGNKLWDKVFDGDGGHGGLLHSINQTADNGYLIAGNVRNYPAPDKTESSLGFFQTWVVKTDSLGNKQWDKTIFTNNSDGGIAIQTAEGCYAIANTSSGGNIGGYQTQNNWGYPDSSSSDYWLVKFCDSTITAINDPPSTQAQIQIYPNPFSTDLNIFLQQPQVSPVGGDLEGAFTITNMLGQVVYTKQENNLSPTYTKMLDLSYLPNGIYVVEVVVDGERVVRRIIKQ